MAELVVLDPSEVATGRTELDITEFIGETGPDWGDAAIEQYLADAHRGQLPVDFRVPNRTITIPLTVRSSIDYTFEQLRTAVQAKAALFQREGGWIKRQTAVGPVYADIVGATLKLGGGTLQAFGFVDADAVLTLEAIPDFYGDEFGDLTDTFTSDTITGGPWVFDAGDGSASVTGGQLVPSNTTEKRLVRTDHRFYDCEATVLHRTPSSFGSTYMAGVVVKRLDENNCLYLRITETGSGRTLTLRKIDGGSDSTVATLTAPAALAVSTSYWLRVRIEGNKVTCQHFTANPSTGAAPATQGTHTLSAANATKYGLGVAGLAGVQWMPFGTSARIDDFQVRPNRYVETTLPELVSAPIYGIKGDYPARTRIIVHEDQGLAQLGLLWGIRSRHYSNANTAALVYEAEALTPLDLAAVATVSGASGGASNNVVRHASLSTNWTPVLSTLMASGGDLAHTGSYRVWARCYTTATAPPTVRLVWDVGDLTLPVENAAFALPGANNFYVVDLGEIRVDPAPIGTHRWKGVVQALGSVGGENISIDRLLFQPLDQVAGLLRAPASLGLGIATYVARDEFNQAAGALTGKTLPVGGIWQGAGDADDFTIFAAGRDARRGATGDANENTGRYVTAGTTSYAGIAVQAKIDLGAASPVGTNHSGLIARYVDQNNWVMFTVQFQQADFTNPFVLRKRVGGTVSTLYGTVLALANSRQLRLVIDAVGRWYVYAGLDRSTLALLGNGLDTDMAAGGTLATGRVGMYHAYASTSGQLGGAFDDFAAWVPDPDAVLFPSQAAELRHDGVFRADSVGVGYGPVSYVVGDLPRLPPAGLEGRPAEVFLKASVGDFDQVPDTSIGDLSAQVLYRPSYLYVPSD